MTGQETRDLEETRLRLHRTDSHTTDNSRIYNSIKNSTAAYVKPEVFQHFCPQENHHHVNSISIDYTGQASPHSIISDHCWRPIRRSSPSRTTRATTALLSRTT